MPKKSPKKKLKDCLIISPIADEANKRRAKIWKRAKYLETEVDAALNPLGYKAELITSDNRKQWITPRMIQRLTSDPLAIAVLDGLNPNCMYEVGIRHAFCLPVIFLYERRPKGPQLPFNIQDVDALAYPPPGRSGKWSNENRNTFQEDIRGRVNGAKTAKASENFAEALDRVSTIKVLRLILSQKMAELDSLNKDLNHYQVILRDDYEVSDVIAVSAADRLFKLIAASNVRVTNRNDALRALATRPELLRIAKKLDSCLTICQKVDQLTARQADLARRLNRKRPPQGRKRRTPPPTRGEIDDRLNETIKEVTAVHREIDALLRSPGL